MPVNRSGLNKSGGTRSAAHADGINRPGNQDFVKLPGQRPISGQGTRQGGAVTHPGRPPEAWHPGRPDGRPGRPDVGDTFINNGVIKAGSYFNNHFGNRPGGQNAWSEERLNYWNNWSQQHSAALNSFSQHREQRWNEIHDFRGKRRDAWQQHSDTWRNWRKDVWDYRADRADEIRNSIRDGHDHWFTPDWWHGCGWWYGGNINVNLNPWWWWQPVVWQGYSVIYGSIPPEPIVYDYGTDIVMESSDVYVDGEQIDSAADYRQQALVLANPSDVPPPPAPIDAKDASIVPLGVWALVQQEKGDAIMFYQLSMTREGLITGGYYNVLTGESAPVTGSVDKKSQRVAWHTGEKSNSVVECNLYGLTKDQTACFVHFGTSQTQEWLLVRLPDPDLPESPISVPSAKPPATPAR